MQAAAKIRGHGGESMRRRFGILIILLTCAAGAAAQNQPYTPEKGSAERKAIVDALRVPVERTLHQPVIFKIDSLKVLNGWAFLLGAPRRPDGGTIDYSRTPFKDAYEHGGFGD